MDINILDDLDSLGIDVTKVWFKPHGYETQVTEGEIGKKFGYDLAQNYRTSNGIRIQSLTVNGNEGLVIFSGGCHILLKYLGTSDCRISIQMNSILLKIDWNTASNIIKIFKNHNKIPHYSPDDDHLYYPGIFLTILNFLKIEVDLEKGDINHLRSLDSIFDMSERISSWYSYSYSIFPKAYKIASKTISDELIPVTPMTEPSGIEFNYQK